MTKRGSLAAFASQKQGTAEQLPAPANASKPKKRRGQTLRLNQDAWRQLKLMTIEQERSAHDLLLEAVRDLFEKYGKQPLS